MSGQMSKAEVELPRLCASRDTLAPVLVRFTLCFPVDWNKKAKAESARPDAGGYHRRKVVYKCALGKRSGSRVAALHGFVLPAEREAPFR